MAKESILAQVATLLDKFSERLVRVARETRQNTDSVATLRDEARLKIGKLQGSVELLNTIAVESGGKAERAHLALINHGELIDKLKSEAEKREASQTARDQNNVQSLVNLRSSTQKAFDQVRDDVASLLKQIQRLNERVGIAESKISLTLVGPSPVDQEIVDSKLRGARSYVDTIEKRLTELEETLRPSVFYLGHKVNYHKNILAINGQPFFPFQHGVASLSVEPFGVVVGLENQDEYILCGGPNPSTMVVAVYKLNPNAKATEAGRTDLRVNP